MNQERIREIYGGCNAENLFGGFQIGGMAEYEDSEDEYEIEGGVYKRLTKKQKDANKAKRAAAKKKAPAKRKPAAKKKGTTYKPPKVKMLKYADATGNEISVNPKDLERFIEQHPQYNLNPTGPKTKYEKYADAKSLAELRGINPAEEAQKILNAYKNSPTSSVFTDHIVRSPPSTPRFNDFLKNMVRIGVIRNLDSAYGAIVGLKPIFDEMEAIFIASGQNPLYDPTDAYAVNDFITDERIDNLYNSSWIQFPEKKFDIVNLAQKQKYVSQYQKKALGAGRY
jgi:hypothetical protein